MHLRTRSENTAARERIEQLPIDEPARRPRLRRGGPRTPLPLLPLIAVAAGIGVAYVAQTAHTTEATYTASSLSAQQQQLTALDQQLGDELARLESSERIVSAAQRLGMRPADRWAYVAGQSVPVFAASPSPQLAGASSNALQQLVGSLSGAAGTSASSGR